MSDTPSSVVNLALRRLGRPPLSSDHAEMLNDVATLSPEKGILDMADHHIRAGLALLSNVATMRKRLDEGYYDDLIIDQAAQRQNRGDATDGPTLQQLIEWERSSKEAIANGSEAAAIRNFVSAYYLLAAMGKDFTATAIRQPDLGRLGRELSGEINEAVQRFRSKIADALEI